MGEKDDDDWDFDPEEPGESDDELSAEAFEFMTNDEPGTQPLNETTRPDHLDYLILDAEDYQEGARQSSIAELPDAPKNESKSKAKAARIVSHLDVSNSNPDVILNCLTRFFEQRSHPATFRAVHELTELQNMSWSFLKNIIELREHWEVRRDYWKIRYGGEIIERQKGELALTWRISCEICEARLDHDPSHMIDSDWIKDWYRLQPNDPGYWDFLAYIRERIKTRKDKELIEGLKMSDDDYNV